MGALASERGFITTVSAPSVTSRMSESLKSTSAPRFSAFILAVSRAFFDASKPTTMPASRNQDPMDSMPVPHPRSTTFNPAMSPLRWASNRTSAAMIAGVMYCSRATSGSSNVRTDWRVISSSLFLIGAPYDGIVHTLDASVRAIHIVAVVSEEPCPE